MKQTRRIRIHEATRREIKNIAWAQIAEKGAAALSLRAIAKVMEVTPPALYRYFSDRDELVTDLIIDAYISFAEALEASLAEIPAEDHAGRYKAIGLAYRDWALTHSQHFSLIFGRPIPGYHAPMQITQPVAARSLSVLMGVIQGAWQAGELKLPQEYQDVPPRISAQLQTWREQFEPEAPVQVVYLTLISWSLVHGLVSLELYQQYPPQISDAGEIFRNELNAFMHRIGM
jgi:AcrR family transcriptional regulator